MILFHWDKKNALVGKEWKEREGWDWGFQNVHRARLLGSEAGILLQDEYRVSMLPEERYSFCVRTGIHGQGQVTSGVLLGQPVFLDRVRTGIPVVSIVLFLS